MPRPKRKCAGGVVYHVLNRANGRLRIFKKRADFEAFERVLAEGLERVDMRLCGYCIMGNHWHLLLWSEESGLPKVVEILTFAVVAFVRCVIVEFVITHPARSKA